MDERALGIPAWLLAPLLLGSVSALAGGYWDDAFHTEHGRDEFLAAPHLAIYGGVTLAGGALAVWIGLAARAGGIRSVVGHPPLALAALSVAVTLASGPIDNTWHLAFGRDAVIWSPPHTLGIIGMAGLATALLLELTRPEAHWPRALQASAGGLLVAALAFLVVEYETDVPQFDVAWYLPVLTTASALGFAIVMAAGRSRWDAAWSAVAQFVFVAGVALLLLALGYDLPNLPLLVVSAALADWLRHRGTAPPLIGLAYAAVVYLVYVPAVNLLGEGIRLEAGDVLLSLPVSALGAAGAFSLVLSNRRPRKATRAVVASVLVALMLAPPAPALAHDPGQGDDRGTMRLATSAQGRTVALHARVPVATCGEFGDGEIVARRAGQTLRAPLERDSCRDFAGALEVSEDGRWFVYAELERAGETVESWLPLKVGHGDETVTDESRYAYTPPDGSSGPMKVIAGALMYGLMLGFVGAIVALVRSRAQPRA